MSGNKGQTDRNLSPGTWLVVGLGRTGLSCARFLSRQGCRVAVADNRPEPPEQARLATELPQVPVVTGPFDEALFASATKLVLSPGVDPRIPAVRAAVDQGIPVLGDVTLFAEQRDAPVIAVTGSNGKSTVVSLLASMAEAAGWRARAGGNLGTPALDLLPSSDHEGAPDLYVLELSSFQLEHVPRLAANVAVVLNVSPDHMDRHAGVDRYAAAKARIFAGAGYAVRNADDPRVMAMEIAGATPVSFGLSRAADYHPVTANGATWLAGPRGLLLNVEALPLVGRHNWANALAALAAGEAAGLPMAALRAGLNGFQGLPHRMTRVAETDGVIWYDDSKATNVGAAAAALAGLTQPVVLIAGGQGKGQDFAPLGDAVRDRVRAAVVLGEDRERVAAALEEVVPVERVADLQEAVTRAAALACPGDAVLLSPACASFDQFTSYAHRGQAFTEAVSRLVPARSALS